MQERRKFIRFSIPLAVDFKLFESTNEHSPGETINFSREGFCFATDTPLLLNDVLELNIQHPYNESLIPVLGEIVWLEQNKNKHFAGVHLKQIDKISKSEILDRAYAIWLENK